MERERIKPELKEHPARLIELVDYQKGSIVSREIISGTGSVTIYAFEEGQSLIEHTRPFDTLVYIIDGEAEITITGIPYKLKEGEAIIIPSGKTHAIKALRRFKVLLTMIRA
jgi:quercetin dioxygenase-like cupin family protein